MTNKHRCGSIPLQFINTSGNSVRNNENINRITAAEDVNTEGDDEKSSNSAIYENEFCVKTNELGPGRVEFEYEGHMTVHYVRTILDKLNYNINKYTEMTIDLSGVNKIDSSAIQLMIIAKRDSLIKNKILRYINASTEVKKTFNTYGLNHYIEV